MAILKINEVNAEQSITSYGYKNIRQFDLTADYNEHLIASLWQDEEDNWHWTKRLYNIETVEDIDTECLDDMSLKGIVKDFVTRVRDWINDEESYLNNLKIEIDEENFAIPVGGE